MNIFYKIYKKIISSKSTYNINVIDDWEKAGKPSPPPHLVKQNIIADFNKDLKYKLFVETGTYLGEMVEAQISNFDSIISIELGNELFENAVEKFKIYPNVTIVHGDSGVVLKEVCTQINDRTIFWLDGHYSSGITAKGDKLCPILEEMSAIFNSKPLHHILLIDDARLFVGLDDYPTISELSTFIKKHRPDANIYCENDIIHVIL